MNKGRQESNKIVYFVDVLICLWPTLKISCTYIQTQNKTQASLSSFIFFYVDICMIQIIIFWVGSKHLALLFFSQFRVHAKEKNSAKKLIKENLNFCESNQ